MKRSISLWKVFITLLLLVMLGLMIAVLIKVNRCCNCNEKRETVFTGHLTEVYDSLTNKKGVTAFIDRLSIGEKGDTIVTTFKLATLWINCPEKEIKAPAVVKKSSYVKKVTKTAIKKAVPEKVTSSLKEKHVKKDTCLQMNVFVTNNSTFDKPKTSGLLKIDLESTKRNKTVSLYSQVNTLPSQSFGTRTITQFNYDVVPDLHIQEYIKRAKKHLWIGTGLASAGAITYASTWFTEIPTFVEYNGLGYFDPANKYYDHNMHERERLNTLKWVRGIGVGVGILGGVEVIHGILLLKNADLSIAPERIILRYSF
jgi:hypothetical protein